MNYNKDLAVTADMTERIVLDAPLVKMTGPDGPHYKSINGVDQVPLVPIIQQIQQSVMTTIINRSHSASVNKALVKNFSV